MNPLLGKSSRQSQQQPQPPDLMRFLGQTSPQQAQQQVQQMLRNGQITQSQLSQAFEQAKRIGESLGLR